MDDNSINPQSVEDTADLIHASKFRYLIDFHTLTKRVSKMPMQIIIDRFLRSEKSKEYKLNIYEKFILTMLASYMGDKLNCWPSFETLKEECSISKNTLLRNIKSLENKKLLKVSRYKNINNEYEFENIIQEIALGSGYQLPASACERQGSACERPLVVPDRDPNNIINNINNKKSYPQAKEFTKYKPHETSELPSPLLMDYQKGKS